ncbi:PHP domain-containing protein [Devosia sp. FJ2-5-3]|jgi:error-prone DNA polymerase|uniref:PHP domain-containing protein n=1 Tax=Devosia sp. FJ2-5-3 TaxID=2976680 RepID=UPI0023D86219|nr:PHP domain-containing protein [Devosia sp. FJ2-5-3]WEJ58153.1 PHP domain-containing protein [Devosia sp. FJ2-5-3]
MLVPRPQAATPYAELLAATNFSFLRGASHPFEMVGQAAGMGLSGIGICDRNSLSRVVRAFAAAKDIAGQYPDFRLIVGTRLVFSDKTSDVAVYPIDRAGYGRLSALLTLGNRRAPKGECFLEFQDLVEHAEGLAMIVIPRLEKSRTTSQWRIGWHG